MGPVPSTGIAENGDACLRHDGNLRAILEMIIREWVFILIDDIHDSFIKFLANDN
jgi:hypothetical protein